MESITFPPVPSEESVDWSYTMRRDMQEIVPGVFLGPYAAAMKSKIQVLQQAGITHIVCIRHIAESHFVKPNFPECFWYLTLDIADTATENIIQHIPKVKRFVDECLHKGGKVLIHGNAGISRSAALVIAYVMEKYGLSHKDAYFYVQQRRFCINPNEGFSQQLKEYEPIYQARLSLQNGEKSDENGMLKRKVREDDEEQEFHNQERLYLPGT
ncbi:serine/threonine/tyrosine-interacting protein A-like [Gigantopelta aegis]|uniref:serine/threonine/tyrosine-interacting protein A-like n=1 Tax=Gigantopelta aegis TaxID=1735272 RepID=UPI001B88D7D3|nr:serine/threonine/tyrosine-interacting protein A-like [Gigantopelta aegis]